MSAIEIQESRKSCVFHSKPKLALTQLKCNVLYDYMKDRIWMKRHDCQK